MKKYISYYRVSTNKQKQSGLGLQSQIDIVTSYVHQNDGQLLSSFEEVESGKNSNRPMLNEALKMCSFTGAVLVIAKLDRLSRNVAFLATLMESGVDFTCCDNPQANKLTIHILAAVAEEERRLISERTKLAIAQAIKRGTRMGTNNLPISSVDSARKANSVHISRSNTFKVSILKVLELVKDMSFHQQARYLNNNNIKSRRGGLWSATTVSRLYN